MHAPHWYLLGEEFIKNMSGDLKYQIGVPITERGRIQRGVLNETHQLMGLSTMHMVTEKFQIFWSITLLPVSAFEIIN